MIVYSYYIHATSGYTGHEHLPYFGLINMNARLYDPVLGRFLGPDPYVQNPLLSQNFNRYSYALNNPLRYMDESGEFIWGIVAVGAFIIGKLYYDGYKANGNEFNPFKWDWGNANYSVGYSSTSGAYGGVGWNNSYGVSGAYNFSQQTPTWGYTYNGTPYMAPMRPYTGGNAAQIATDQAIGKARFTQGTRDRLYYLLNPGASYEYPWMSMASTALTAGENAYYSKAFGTWMGKDFKIRGQNWGGNGATGGKYKFGRRVARWFKWAGWGIGGYNTYQTYAEYQRGEMNEAWYGVEQTSNAYSTLGGIYGAAWGIGWELGRSITNTDTYQEFKYNFWYDYLEDRIGRPSSLNEHLWYEYFYKNYKP